MSDTGKLTKKCGIYALCCPDTGAVRYVGQSVNISRRFAQHKSKSLSFPSSLWIQSLKAQGKVPVLKVLCNCKREELDALEIDYIAKFGLENLLNAHPGGHLDPAKFSKRAGSILKVEGFVHPYIAFIRSVFVFRNSEKGREYLQAISNQSKSCKTEEEKINFAMNCAQWVIKNGSKSAAYQMEKYAIKVCEQINRKYPGRMTIQYNDGIEVTP